jgi:RNA polymerase sigma factor (sigma-70 family)
MKTWGTAEHDLRTLFQAGALGNLSDGELLERFVVRRDESAFEAIVRRHGPMVLGVCRRVLRDHHDVEDAFQATFLVLARKAGTVRPGSMLPNWLYGVAHQVAIKARAINARRRSRERQVTAMPEPATVPSAPVDDLRGLIDRELSRLPDKYRAPVILCDL